MKVGEEKRTEASTYNPIYPCSPLKGRRYFLIMAICSWLFCYMLHDTWYMIGWNILLCSMYTKSLKLTSIQKIKSNGENQESNKKELGRHGTKCS